MSDINETRTLNYELTLKANAEDVWKALTEGGEISKWFALDAKVTPGEGGSMWLSWGPQFEAETPIEIWDEPRHFRSVSEQTKADGTPRKVTVDYFVEAIDGGNCRLRLVHSGFGTNADWDDEFDAIRDGWKIFLRNLRHYIDHHQGKPAHNSWTIVPTTHSPEECWDRLVGSLVTLDGERWQVNAGPGNIFNGAIDLRADGAVLGGVCEELGGALLRLTFSPYFKAVEVTMLGYDLDKAAFEGARDAVIAAVKRGVS